MDANRFDHLTRWVSAGGNRRKILALLSGLSLGGITAHLAGDEDAEAKRHRHNDKGKDKARQRRRRRSTAADAAPSASTSQGAGEEVQPHKKHCRHVKRKGHGHHGRRKHCEAHHRPGSNKGKGKGKGKTPPCQPESLALTCADTCGSVTNNCQQTVDCGSCKCQPACPICQRCNETTATCEPDPDQIEDPCGDGLLCQADGQCACQGQSCGGCRACEDGRCVVDATILCTAQDQCHEAGVCDPQTGACTNPAKADGASCDDGDPCTSDDTCQNGVCRGTPKDCSAEGNVCNDGVCRADGTCGKRPKADGTSCNADSDSCTEGDSCQNGECTAGAGVNCHDQDDACNDGVCRTADGQCVKRPKADGTPCGDDGTCQNGACQEPTCKELGDTCNPGNNRCCQDDPTSCAALAPNCYAGGEPQDERCCRATRDTCGADCECCGIAGCEGGNCCNHTGETCQSATDCCTRGVLDPSCLNGTCCVTEGQFCEDDADCCSGSCPDGFCVGCLPLQAECESADECCQAGGTALCRDSFDFDSANCCRPKGGTCSENADCCQGRACNAGRCCEGEHFACDSNADCCSGLECRNGYCRSNICREAGESCPPGSPACCPGSGACTDGRCCNQIGEACAPVPFFGNPCCGNSTECGGANGSTCCITDFAGVFGGGGECTSDDQCCSGYCHSNSVCCRPQGASCTQMGGLNFECCDYLGLTCNANGAGTCVPCSKLGQACVSDGSDSTCCIGSYCDNGICKQDSCGIGGAPCQDASTCCPGSICSGGAVCLKICQAEGEFCRCFGDTCAPFPCCSGLTCSADEKCVRP